MEGSPSTPVPQQQLTFSVGGDLPTESIVRIGGALHTHREIAKGTEVHIQVVGTDGEVVADGYGRVVQVSFKDRQDADGFPAGTDRIHSIKAS